MKRILYITDSLGCDGLAAQLLLLARGMIERGFDVHVAKLDRSGGFRGEFHAAGVSVTEIGRRWSYDPVAGWQLRRVLRKVQPDLVHAWGVDAPTLATVVGRGGRWPIVAGHYRIDPWKSDAAWRMERQLSRHVSKFVCNSDQIRAWHKAHGVDPGRFDVIPFGVAPARASDVSREDLLRELNLPTDARLIGVVGRLAPEKRIRDLIWAADLLRVLHDNLRVLIIGDGPERPLLEQYARLTSDLDHIRFLGERSDVWRIMPHLDVLWNGSENRGQSVAMLEAMAAGVPVLASDTAFNRGLVVDGETGYLIPLGHRAGRADRARNTDRIFTDANLTARLATNGIRRLISHFSAERMVQQYIDFYSDRAIGLPTGRAVNHASAT